MNLVTSNSPLSSDTLNEALDLAVAAIDELGLVQTRISNASADAWKRPHQCRCCCGDSQAGHHQAQLTASYSAIAKVQSLNLASYLR